MLMALPSFVNPEAVPRFYSGWRDKVMTQVARALSGWQKNRRALESMKSCNRPFGFTKDQCLDLPPVITMTREVPLTAQQAKYYRLLKDRMVMYSRRENHHSRQCCRGVNKLLQISAGAAYTDNAEVIEFDCNPRLNVLLEVLEETERKVIVFAAYRHSIDTISEFLQKNNIDCMQIHGDVTQPSALRSSSSSRPRPPRVYWSSNLSQQRMV